MILSFCKKINYRQYIVLRFFLISIFSIGLLANTAVDVYRNKGITAVEQYIQTQLQSKSYWDVRLKDMDTRYGYYEDLGSLFLANKKHKKLDVYNYKNKKLIQVEKLDVIVGASGDKKVEGDLKTPIGVYEVTRRFVPDELFYGPLAYELSYPNTYDRVQGKNGYGIWIHGSPLDGSNRDPMSKGCVVLTNADIKLIDKKISPKKAIAILGEGEIEQVSKDDLSILLSELFVWQEAWRENQIEKYLGFYAADFNRFDGKGKEQFSRFKKSIFSRGEKKKIIFNNINIAPYPNEENKKLFKIAFDEIYETKNHKFDGHKELYVQLRTSSFEILSEK